ncbi:hypothetical protein NL676_026952 [Syzygium grande]|nr:hypothetical protein NL676_026952 [Syzygium grande]
MILKDGFGFGFGPNATFDVLLVHPYRVYSCDHRFDFVLPSGRAALGSVPIEHEDSRLADLSSDYVGKELSDDLYPTDKGLGQTIKVFIHSSQITHLAVLFSDQNTRFGANRRSNCRRGIASLFAGGVRVRSKTKTTQSSIRAF